SRRRVTGVTAAGAVEIRAPCGRIARDDVENLVRAPVRGGQDARMEECRKIADVPGRIIELRHAFVGPPDSQKRAQLLPVLILEHDGGAQQIGTARSAARVGAVAEAALLAEQLLAAGDGRRIDRGWTTSPALAARLGRSSRQAESGQRYGDRS